MKTELITDDLNELLELLPRRIQNILSTPKECENLIEIILDLGRIPEARYPNKVITLGDQNLNREEIQAMVNHLGKFGGDNRAGIERTLHRISAIRNRQGEIIGLTCRVGRAVFGTVEIIRDLLNQGKSILLMGRPGVGKTTALREIARVLADELNKRVVIIDTSNEIAGDGDIPHPAIGKARRMQVSKPEKQHQVMIEAVENHMPEVIVIDEIGTELEANAARTIAERGVQLVATAHGNSMENLIKNPTLSDLIGGIQSVTLGDEEARRRKSQKTVLERASDPTFSVAIEINNQKSWSVHTDVSKTVDLLLRGHKVIPQQRKVEENGSVKLIEPKQTTVTTENTLKQEFLSAEKNKSIKADSNRKDSLIKIIGCGIPKQLLEEVTRRNSWGILWVEDINNANFVISVRKSLGKEQNIRRKAKELLIPIIVIKSASFRQVERSLERLIQRQAESSHKTQLQLTKELDPEDSLAAMEECRLALEQVVVPLGRPVELLPRSKRIIDMQAELVTRYRLRSDVFGQANQQHLRVYPP